MEVEENRKATAEPVKYPITQKLIRDARLRSGLQQKEFISQNNLEITQATFSSWETGQAQVPVDVLLKLGLAREAIVQ
nr:transcriptional regulator [Vibrio lentus]